MTAINPDKPIPQKIENFFKDIPWSDWEKIKPELLEQEDIGKAEEFKDKGEVPAGWVVRELGFSGFEFGPLKISEEDCNTILNLKLSANIGHLVQLSSFIKMKARNKIGLRLLESVDCSKF